jgi:hypothetical protein
MLIFAIALTFSIMSPLLLPLALIYFVAKHCVDKYNLLYVRPRDRGLQNSGAFSSTLAAFVVLALLLYQLTMMIFFMSRITFGPSRQTPRDGTHELPSGGGGGQLGGASFMRAHWVAVPKAMRARRSNRRRRRRRGGAGAGRGAGRAGGGAQRGTDAAHRGAARAVAAVLPRCVLPSLSLPPSLSGTRPRQMIADDPRTNDSLFETVLRSRG